MKTFKEIVAQACAQINEVFPWDVEERIQQNKNLLLVDIREECEFTAFHIKNTLLIPRGILETACEAEYEDVVPELMNARTKEVILICRSGNRSALATLALQTMGYQNVSSMKTGLRGWNDYDLPLYNIKQTKLDPDDVEQLLNAGFCSNLMHKDRRSIIS